MVGRPTIAVVSTSGEDRNANYLRALERHGAAWQLIRPGEPPSPTGVHGLLLTGGGDLSEAHYAHALDDAERATLGKIEPERDEFEFGLLRWSASRGVPVLGICRGLQVMGAFAGGRLVPDLPTWARRRGDPAPQVVHRASGEDATHPVEVAPGTRLAAALGAAGATAVNSCHHQGLDSLPPGLAAGARAADGILEAIEDPRREFWIGVQFHPERMACNEEAAAALFAAFIRAAERAG